MDQSECKHWDCEQGWNIYLCVWTLWSAALWWSEGKPPSAWARRLNTDLDRSATPGWSTTAAGSHQNTDHPAPPDVYPASQTQKHRLLQMFTAADFLIWRTECESLRLKRLEKVQYENCLLHSLSRKTSAFMLILSHYLRISTVFFGV